ncbi:ApeP family dehydratase [Curvivirga aplysinae]|uniref:ApeP family dehydratase n=1 Tax=Curvivirga aplysinae TaxID=2529852 RepID=UPI0012BC09AA|nr:3-hydroxylacyl-ACP dehydratase [Curvivirga aplysinae]MTI11022.1 3-hydroxylacyl-ACP dehydratase [Curvivirga aplysinae]
MSKLELKSCHYSTNDLLAHEAPMILVDKVVGYNETSIKSVVCINEKAPFLYGDAVPAYIAVEYMAQTIACHKGVLALDLGEDVKIGFLLGTRKLTLSESDFLLGDILEIEASVLYNDGEMAAFECIIMREGVKVSNATLNVYQPDNFDAMEMT